MAKTTIASEEKVRLLTEALEDRKGQDIVTVDLRDKGVILADYFLVCTGTSIPHIRALAERVLEVTKDEGLTAPRVAGEAVAEWVLLDYGDVVLHLMNEEARTRYRLEEFWTTPQPKGALPPQPGDAPLADDEGDPLADWDEDDDDAAFFAEADQAVEPIDEDDES